jgi:hypothetical protein
MKCLRMCLWLMIHNIHKPICKNCIHYISSEQGKCKLFGEMDLVTGKIKHESAEICRIYDWRCGQDGEHFEFEPDFKIRFLINHENEIKIIFSVLMYLIIMNYHII